MPVVNTSRDMSGYNANSTMSFSEDSVGGCIQWSELSSPAILVRSHRFLLCLYRPMPLFDGKLHYWLS